MHPVATVLPTGIRASRIERLVDISTTILALILIPVLYIEATSADPRWLAVAAQANWFVWWAFVVDASVKLAIHRRRWLRTPGAWAAIAIVVLSFPNLAGWIASLRAARLARLARGTRLMRFVRAARFVRVIAVVGRAALGLRRVLQPSSLPYVTAIVLAITLGGGATLHLVERDEQTTAGIADGIWWAVATVTTVGYGDIYPHSPEGRLLAVVVMIIGIAFTSLLTAQVAAYVTQER